MFMEMEVIISQLRLHPLQIVDLTIIDPPPLLSVQ